MSLYQCSGVLSWQHKEPGHQHACYEPNCHGLFRSVILMKKINGDRFNLKLIAFEVNTSGHQPNENIYRYMYLFMLAISIAESQLQSVYVLTDCSLQ